MSTPRRPGSGQFVQVPVEYVHGVSSARRLLGVAANHQIGASVARDLDEKLSHVQRAGDAVLQALAIINGACGVSRVAPPSLDGANKWAKTIDELCAEYERTGGVLVHGEEPVDTLVTESVYLDAGDREELFTA